MTVTSSQGITSARTLDALARHYGYSDAELATLAGEKYTGPTVQGRRKGRKALDADELEDFGGAFGVPTYVLLMEPADALRWVIDNVEGSGIPTWPVRRRSGPARTGHTERYAGRAARHLFLITAA